MRRQGLKREVKRKQQDQKHLGVRSALRAGSCVSSCQEQGFDTGVSRPYGCLCADTIN